MRKLVRILRGGCAAALSLVLLAQQCFAVTVADLIPKFGLNSTISGNGPKEMVKAEVQRLQTSAIAFVSLAFMTCVFFLAYNITRLGTTGGNEMERKRAINRILYSGIAIALLGSLDFVLAFFWGYLR